MKKKFWFIFLPLLLYLPSLGNFFSADDWFHLRLGQISSLGEFFQFFSFERGPWSASFYRPLPTQVFFFLGQKLFGLTSWPYYLFVLLCFGYSLYLVYRFASVRLGDNRKALVASLVYGLSVSNFTRVYFLSAFQEISLVIFSLLCLLSFEKSLTKSIIFFILALLSKETAIVLPFLILLLGLPHFKKHPKRFIPYLIISLVYLYQRLLVFGFSAGDSYSWSFSLPRALNTVFWYGLWSLGTPELLVDYIGSGFRPIPKLFTDLPFWWFIIFALLFLSFVCLFLLVIKNFREKKFTPTIIYLLFFFISLGPVIFLPEHKFSLELGLPLVAVSLAIAHLVPAKPNKLSLSFLLIYLFFNLSSLCLTYTRHYSIKRGDISRSVYTEMKKNYPVYPVGYYFEFVNDMENYGQEWGQSKQISQALSQSDFFRVYYKNHNLGVYYQDIPGERPSHLKPLYLSSKKFIK